MSFRFIAKPVLLKLRQQSNGHAIHKAQEVNIPDDAGSSFIGYGSGPWAPWVGWGGLCCTLHLGPAG